METPDNILEIIAEGERTRQEAIADNANLTAAAPDLFQALLALHNWAREHTAARDTLPLLLASHRALARAWGKPEDEPLEWCSLGK